MLSIVHFMIYVVVSVLRDVSYHWHQHFNFSVFLPIFL
jgi:hypothetical protein